MLRESGYYTTITEQDIPEEFLSIIRNEELSGEEVFPEQFVPGKTGGSFTDLSSIQSVFTDEDCFYLGHGTASDDGVINSIFDEGLYVKDPEEVKGYISTLRGLSSTTVALGVGSSELFGTIQDELDHWRHKDAKKIIIVEIPKEYSLYMDVNGDAYEPFYVKSNHPDDYQGLRLRPEFIRGVYDAENYSFTENAHYYKKLSMEQQQSIMQDVKQQYIRTYANDMLVCPSELEFSLPLDEDEMKLADLEWYRVQYRRMKEDVKSLFTEDDTVEEFDDSTVIPNSDWDTYFADWEDPDEDIKIL